MVTFNKVRLFNRVKELCDKKEITISFLEQKTEISNGSIAKWTSSIPKANNLLKVAQYLGVSTDYLLDYTPATPTASPTATTQHAPSLTPDEQALLSSYRQLNTNDKQDVQDYIEYRRSKSPFKDDKAI